MRILYVSPIWTGIRSIIFEANSVGAGMPAFVRPLQHILQSGHHVDLAFFGSINEEEVLRPADWLRKSTITVHQPGEGRVQRVVSYWTFLLSIRRMLREQNYDFVYGHGLPGVVGTIAARQLSIPTGQRLYGTFLTQHISRNAHIGAMRHSPLEYWAFRSPKAFLLVTNDGTKGDLVYSRIGSKRYAFHFVHNGVDAPSGSEPTTCSTELDSPYLLYPGRTSPWKRQHLAIELVAELRTTHGIDVPLKFVGQSTDPEYFEHLVALAKQLAVSDIVTFLGQVSRNDLGRMYRHALAVLSFYELSNLGNVIIEALSKGAVVISLDDGSLDGVIAHGINGLLASNPREAALQVKELMQDPNLRERIGAEARRSANELFLDWDTRATLELALISDAVRRAPQIQ